MALEVEALKVERGGVRVLSLSQLTLKRGRWIALIGPNGAGKSTALHGILGSLPKKILKERRLLLEGEPLSAYSAKAFARWVTLLPQLNTLNPYLSVEELVMLGRYPHQSLSGVASERDRQVVKGLLSRVKLQHKKHSPLGALSGGERQRALLAMNLAQKTPYLFLDEPSNFMDPQFKRLLHTLLKERVREGGVVLQVTHDVNEALHFSDELVALKEGKVVAAGLTKKILTPQLLTTLFDVPFRRFTDEASRFHYLFQEDHFE